MSLHVLFDVITGDELVIDEDNSRTYNVSMEKNTLIEILLEKLPRDIFSRETIQHMVNSLESELLSIICRPITRLI